MDPNQTFTGLKDTDLVIFDKLDDQDLLRICSTSKYVNQLCNNETFWRNRFFKKWGKTELKNKTWKRYYLTTAIDMDLLSGYFIKRDNIIKTNEDKLRFIELLNKEISQIDFIGGSVFAIQKYLKSIYYGSKYQSANMSGIVVLRGMMSVEHPVRPDLYLKMKRNFGYLADDVQIYLAGFLENIVIVKFVQTMHVIDSNISNI